MKKFKYTQKDVQILANTLKKTIQNLRVSPLDLGWFNYRDYNRNDGYVAKR